LSLFSDPNITECDYCKEGDVSKKVRDHYINYCKDCTEVPSHIPSEQIREYIRKKFYENNL